MAETSSHLFLHELSQQGLYLFCQVQVSERRALKPPKKGKQKTFRYTCKCLMYFIQIPS